MPNNKDERLRMLDKIHLTSEDESTEGMENLSMVIIATYNHNASSNCEQ